MRFKACANSGVERSLRLKCSKNKEIGEVWERAVIANSDARSKKRKDRFACGTSESHFRNRVQGIISVVDNSKPLRHNAFGNDPVPELSPDGARSPRGIGPGSTTLARLPCLFRDEQLSFGIREHLSFRYKPSPQNQQSCRSFRSSEIRSSTANASS